MSTEVWGNMPKSLADAETPEQMAERVVQAHNDDPDSHLEEGQSLTSHRASEIIDHAARSIVGDKVNTIEDVGRCLYEGVITGKAGNVYTDTSQSWMPGELVGHFCLMMSGEFVGGGIDIIANTENTFTLDPGGEDWLQIGDSYAVTACQGSPNSQIYFYSALDFNGMWWYSTSLDEYLYRTFSCNGAAIIARTGPGCGKMEVYVNDVLDSVVDCYSAELNYRVRVWEKKWETLEDREIKIVNIHEKNPLSNNYILYINGFDINGVIPFPALDSSVYNWRDTMTTNANGYAAKAIELPDGYSVVSVVGWNCSGHNSSVVKTPIFYIYPSGNGITLIIDEGQASTAFTIDVWLMLYKREPLVYG